MSLAPAVERSKGRTHEDVAVRVGLDAVRRLRENKVGQNFHPTCQVRPRPRLKIWKLDRDRHSLDYTRKVKTALKPTLASKSRPGD